MAVFGYARVSSKSKAYRKTCCPRWLLAQQLEHGEAVVSQATASPSIRQDRTLSAFTASTISG
jgi:hypothetical protein